MANHISAKKRARQAIKRNARNTAFEARMKTMIKKFRAGLAKGENLETLQKSLTDVQSVIARAGSKGVIHSNNASRKIARLTAALGRFAGSADNAKTASPAKKNTKSKAAKAAAGTIAKKKKAAASKANTKSKSGSSKKK